MAITQNLLEYAKSISSELEIEKDRVRRLIGSSHWQTDGEHKEAVLRRVIRSMAPELFRIGCGFVCYPQSQESSSQLDILVVSKLRPKLYQDGNLMFVTANTAEAVAEVKTKTVKGKKFLEVLRKLADNLEQIRSTSEQDKPCWGGLFIYEENNSLTHKYVLQSLQKVTKGNVNRAINCISIAQNLFIRFWPNGHPDTSPERQAMWHSYQLNKLAQAYFIGNLLFHITPNISIDDAAAWFPITGTKERKRCYYAEVSKSKAKSF